MFNPASCAFCDKLFTLPLGGVISPYGAVCNECKTKALTETDSSHEIEADRPDPTESYGFDEDWQDTMKSDSAFERAFALLKMPYHGTNEETAKKILRHGTRAFRDKRPTFKRDPARFWMTSNPKEAMRHARSKGARGRPATKDTDDWRETGFSRPTVLYISDEGVDSVPHETWGNEDRFMGKITTHRHPHRIDPKYISIHSQGPKPDIPEPFDWSNEEANTSEGLAHGERRQKAIDDYKQKVYAWRGEDDS